MAVHDVIADESGVTALKLGGDPGFATDLGEVVGRVGCYREAVAPKIIRIAVATPAFRVFVKHYRDRCGVCRSRQRQGGCRHQKSSSGKHVFLLFAIKKSEGPPSSRPAGDR